MSKRQDHCPACGAGIRRVRLQQRAGLSASAEAPLRCTRCAWHLVSLVAWKALPPFDQGWFLYMQGSWPTSEIAKEKNPYVKDTSAWTAFREGEQRAARDAQDGEE